MRKTHGFFSWALTSVLTIVSAFGIVALTTGGTAASSASTAATTSANTAALSTATVTAPHVVTYKTTYHDDSSSSSYQGDN
ncbi:MAG: hypothetical protein HKL86_08965 [Acidimicrobiaceae bacterium]|nr:hypothetical protein [Acidimicrobiaceae bacterium]